LLGLILEGKVGGKKHRGRPQFQYMSQIIENGECNSYQKVMRKANDRKA